MFKRKLENDALLFSTILRGTRNFVARLEFLAALLMQFLLKSQFFFFCFG